MSLLFRLNACYIETKRETQRPICPRYQKPRLIKEDLKEEEKKRGTKEEKQQAKSFHLKRTLLLLLYFLIELI